MKNFQIIAKIGASSLVVASLMLAMAGILMTAHAASTTSTAAAQDEVVRVDAKGTALVRGWITSIANGSLTVKSWGGDWTVSVMPGAQILPDITGNDISGFQVGDYVGAQGTIDQSANWTVDATLVRDWTYKDTMAAQKKQNQSSASQTIKANTPKNYMGVMSGLSGSAFTLTVQGATTTATYAVNVTDGAEVVNRNWINLPLPGLTDGDSIRVWGIADSGSIAAQIVRDMTLPATSTPATSTTQ